MRTQPVLPGCIHHLPGAPGAPGGFGVGVLAADAHPPHVLLHDRLLCALHELLNLQRVVRSQPRGGGTGTGTVGGIFQGKVQGTELGAQRLGSPTSQPRLGLWWQRSSGDSCWGGEVTISCTPCVPLSKSLLLTTLLCQGGMPSWGGGSTAVGQGSEAMGQREAEGGRADVQLPGCRWRARTAAGTEEQSRTWGAARRLGGPRSGGAAHSAAARSASGVDLAALWAVQSTAGAEHGAPLPSLGPEPSQGALAPRPHPEGVFHTPLLLGCAHQCHG